MAFIPNDPFQKCPCFSSAGQNMPERWRMLAVLVRSCALVRIHTRVPTLQAPSRMTLFAMRRRIGRDDGAPTRLRCFPPESGGEEDI